MFGLNWGTTASLWSESAPAGPASASPALLVPRATPTWRSRTPASPESWASSPTWSSPSPSPSEWPHAIVSGPRPHDACRTSARGATRPGAGPRGAARPGRLRRFGSSHHEPVARIDAPKTRRTLKSCMPRRLSPGTRATSGSICSGSPSNTRSRSGPTTPCFSSRSSTTRDATRPAPSTRSIVSSRTIPRAGPRDRGALGARAAFDLRDRDRACRWSELGLGAVGSDVELRSQLEFQRERCRAMTREESAAHPRHRPQSPQPRQGLARPGGRGQDGWRSRRGVGAGQAARLARAGQPGGRLAQGPQRSLRPASARRPRWPGFGAALGQTVPRRTQDWQAVSGKR